LAEKFDLALENRGNHKIDMVIPRQGIRCSLNRGLGLKPSGRIGLALTLQEDGLRLAVQQNLTLENITAAGCNS